MSLITESCGFCKGSGAAQRLEELRSDGWHRNTMLEHYFADAWITADRFAPVRWADCACPSCDGAKTVVVEYVKAKVF